MSDRAHEHLSNVVRVDVMNGLEAEIGQRKLFAFGQHCEDARVEVPGGV